ncbi:MAG: 2-amino-4-hydroxy-6-hydroxymethyldihydropteridine diphosphokinase [Gemmatimonadaceae bacterium]
MGGEVVAFVALGSNLGDRAAFLARAREAMASLPATRLLAASRIEETPPIGPVPQGPYLNQMVALATTLPPHDLLAALLRIEREAGRVRAERWGPRTLDLDIVRYGELRLRDERLVVPHPGLASRDFWRRELAELQGILARTMPDLISHPSVCVELPSWAEVTPRRREHIERVTGLLMRWADALGLDDAERQAWHDVGRWHDALRDASEETLRGLVPGAAYQLQMLHGPAAAARLEREGESRASVLAAIRFHTVGDASWDRVGRALYMADYLEPGRPFARADRAFLARQVPADFDGVFRQVVQARIKWALREGKSLYPEMVALWNCVR